MYCTKVFAATILSPFSLTVTAHHLSTGPLYQFESKAFSDRNADGSKTGITIGLYRHMHEFKLFENADELIPVDENLLVENENIYQSNATPAVSRKQVTEEFSKKPKDTTASKNVHILDTAFYIPQLQRYRRIWIYLPPSYTTSRKKYPVLYMQDGQNVFDAATSFSGEWGVDEALDSLGERNEMIVVAIDNGGEKRINEYAPYNMPKYGKGEGDAYVDFLVKTLQPYINKHYRTQKKGKFNYIAGSSLGGLISFYAVLKYPGSFGGAGIFSPALWINPGIKNIDARKAKKIKSKLYFFAGQLESGSMVPDMLYVFDQMEKHSKAKMQTVIRAEGKHNETTWRAEFPLFIEWLLKK